MQEYMGDNEIQQLKEKLYHAEKQINNIMNSYHRIESERDCYREIISAHNDIKDNKEDADYWAWEPGEDNHLESLSGDVLIPAEWLRELVEESYLSGMLDAYRIKMK